MIIALIKLNRSDIDILVNLFQFALMKISLGSQNLKLEGSIENTLSVFLKWPSDMKASYSSFENKEWNDKLMYEYKKDLIRVKNISSKSTVRHDYPDWIVTGIDSVDKIKNIQEKSKCLLFRVTDIENDSSTGIIIGKTQEFQIKKKKQYNDVLSYPVNYTIFLNRNNYVQTVLEIEHLLLHYRSIVS
jgi:hypothetical protein